MYVHAKDNSYKAMIRAAPAWSVDVSKFNYMGIQSIKGGIVIHRWGSQEKSYMNYIDVSFSDEALVCYSAVERETKKYTNIGCVTYPY